MANKRRGSDLEQQINRVFGQLREYRLALPIRLEIKSRVDKQGRQQYLEKQPFDYAVLSPKGVFCFDAKECAGEKWYPKKAPEHQRDSLQFVMDMRHHAAFVVHFTQFRGMPGALRWITDFVNPATVESGIAFDWGMFLEDNK